jgi:hypothetical protein
MAAGTTFAADGVFGAAYNLTSGDCYLYGVFRVCLPCFLMSASTRFKENRVRKRNTPRIHKIYVFITLEPFSLEHNARSQSWSHFNHPT